MHELFLPFPPTVNSYWAPVRNTPARRVSAKGRKFRAQVIQEVSEQFPILGKTRIDYQVQLTVVLYPPDNRTRDLDNYMKALLDALTHAGVWEDDSQADQLLIYRGAITKGGLAYVQIDYAGPVLPLPKARGFPL